MTPTRTRPRPDRTTASRHHDRRPPLMTTAEHLIGRNVLRAAGWDIVRKDGAR